MSDPQATIEAFFAAFARHDAPAMAAAYAADALFDDPVFGELSGVDAGLMWRMLLAKTDLSLEYRVRPDGADWIARYTYATADEKARGTPGRRVENHVRSTITLRDGRIVRQHDVFSFPRWARQALPLSAGQRLLTYLPPLAGLMQAAVRKGAGAALAAFKEKNAQPNALA